jgi:3',5'-cyclic AMP phosphodiesterase CpdA
MLIAHASDIHFGSENVSAIETATRAIRDAATDLLIVSGDLTQRGKKVEFEQAAQWLDKFPCPILSVPGNHDVPLLNVASRAHNPFKRYEAFLGQYSHSRDVNEVLVSGINTARGWQVRKNWAEGSVNIANLNDAILKNHSPQILACHHPFLPVPHAPMKTLTRRGLKASKILAASGTEILLTGHVHKPSAVVHRHEEGAYLNITSGTLSTRLRDHMASFNFIELTNDLIEMRVIVCRPDGYEQQTVSRWRRKTLESLIP